MSDPKGMFYIDGEPDIVTRARRHILNAFQDLEFQEEGHLYTLHGQTISLSVSTVGHRFVIEPFDEVTQSQRYAERHGEKTAEQWLHHWHCNAFRATTLGTKTHEFGESLGYLRAGHPELIRPSIRAQYDATLGYLAPIHPKEDAAAAFLGQLPSCYHLVLNEAKVYSGKNPDPAQNLTELICGTFDMLYYYDGEGDPTKAGFVIFDYKTNRSLTSDYNRRVGRTLMSPFTFMIEEDQSLYTIQLSLYALMLADIGVPVIKRALVWLMDTGQYQLVELPDVSHLLRGLPIPPEHTH